MARRIPFQNHKGSGGLFGHARKFKDESLRGQTERSHAFTSSGKIGGASGSAAGPVIVPEVDPYAVLKASPFDFGTIAPGSDSAVTLEIPGDAELFVQVTNVVLQAGAFIDFKRTNPTETDSVAGELAVDTPASAGNHTEGQILTIGNRQTGVTPTTFEVLVDSEIIAIGTLDVILL